MSEGFIWGANDKQIMGVWCIRKSGGQLMTPTLRASEEMERKKVEVCITFDLIQYSM